MCVYFVCIYVFTLSYCSWRIYKKRQNATSFFFVLYFLLELLKQLERLVVLQLDAEALDCYSIYFVYFFVYYQGFTCYVLVSVVQSVKLVQHTGGLFGQASLLVEGLWWVDLWQGVYNKKLQSICVLKCFYGKKVVWQIIFDRRPVSLICDWNDHNGHLPLIIFE